jgi:exopolysaccharide biosynthesis polyprenyl glycosylphosphotransferase
MSERASRKTQYLSAVVLSRVLEAPSAPPIRRASAPPVENRRAFLARAVKQSLDVSLAIWALICLSPLLLAVAALIKLDSRGPVIFRQYRIGHRGRRFKIYKFRTMSVLENGPDIAQARRNDPRVTKIGRLLRRSSIDELPQLFNVLKGDMSIVGPRPHAVSHDIYYGALIPEYDYRRTIKPGITGWAQVNGVRGETATIEEMQRRVKFDLWYIDNWSLGLDLQIAWRTCFEVIRWNAY